VTQQEIDYIEEADSMLSAFKFKWNPQAKSRFAKTFLDAYKPVETQVIHKNNYWEWLTNKP
jgi:hypothetical protein